MDNDTHNHSLSPYDRLIYLISDIYQPDQENLWLVSVVPLLLALSRKSSDYTRDLYEQQLDTLMEFYDWDFRGATYFRQFNTSQPLTPIFTLS